MVRNSGLAIDPHVNLELKIILVELKQIEFFSYGAWDGKKKSTFRVKGRKRADFMLIMSGHGAVVVLVDTYGCMGWHVDWWGIVTSEIYLATHFSPGKWVRARFKFTRLVRDSI